jgi:hypothetical protein
MTGGYNVTANSFEIGARKAGSGDVDWSELHQNRLLVRVEVFFFFLHNHNSGPGSATGSL